MSLPEHLTLRTITGDERVAYMRAIGYQFGDEPTEERVRARSEFIDQERSFAVFNADQIVGTARVIGFQMSVPGGGDIPLGGLSSVGVRTDHRRRGLLHQLMRRQLDDTVGRGEIASALYASEAPIYGRFGYGPAVPYSNVTFRRERFALRTPASEVARDVVLVDAAQAREQCEPIYVQFLKLRAGAMHRTDHFWRRTLDPASFIHDESNPRIAVLPGRGYVLFSVEPKWEAGLPDGTLKVQELVAVDPEAEAALWTFVASVDLIGTIKAHARPSRDVLALAVEDPAHLKRAGSESMYLRLVDIAACLEARTYDAAGSVTLGVTDPFLPDNTGTYRLHVGQDGATCERVDGQPDLVMDVGTLSAAYLGGESFTRLAWGQRLDVHNTVALRQADRMFATPLAPWNPVHF